jgi:hypothetical protein
LNSAAQQGQGVNEEVRRKAEDYAKKQAEPPAKRDAGGPAASGRSLDMGGAAGVELYARASSISGLQDSVNTNAQRDDQLKAEVDQIEKERKVLSDKADDPKSREQLEALGKRKDDVVANLKRNVETAQSLKDAQDALVKRLDDDRFVAGFGSNGGEEFLSYLNIGESLVIKGDEIWKKWDEKTTANLNRIQNEDGSWNGHHCITGRTFCTAAALLVLTVDRSPVPVAKEMARR